MPDEALPLMDVLPSNADSNVCAIDVALWTVEEGRSDLTLSLVSTRNGDQYRLAIDDLHVL